MTKPSIAFFDFDGTITTKDTLIEMIRFQKGSTRLYTGMLLLSPWLIAMKLKLMSNQQAKEKVLSYFFGGTPLKQFQEKCDAYISKKLSVILRPGALEEIAKHKANNTVVVVVTASPEIWVNTWCQLHNLQCIGTVLENNNGVLTGKITGKNCYGLEKVNRIKEQFQLSSFDSIFCYGDTKGDKPMLSLATFAFYKPFTN